MGLSIGHLLLILIVVFVIFGPGKLPNVLKDIGRGIRGLRDELQKDNSGEFKDVSPKNKDE